VPKRYTPVSAAADVEAALRLLEGRWKLVILKVEDVREQRRLEERLGRLRESLERRRAQVASA
jgi:DNA-binding HxlR family transcriptional regulator